MANIKIPRGTIEQPKVSAGNSSMLSAVQSNRINYDKLTNTVEYAVNKIQAHNLKVEEQRIDNTNTKRTSLLKGEINQELENLKNNQDLNTDGDYNLKWDTVAKNLETKYKKLYKGDDKAFERFESTMYAAFNDGQIAMWKERRKKVLAEAQINFDSATQEFKNDLDKQDVTPNIWVSTDLLLKKEKERFIKAKALGITVDWGKYQTEVNDMVWKKVITANHQYTDTLTGKIEIDYLKVYNDLTASKSTQTWFGKKMDRETKNGLSAWAKKRHDEQDAILTDTHARIDNDNSVEINKILNEFSLSDFSSVPEGVDAKTFISDKVLNGKFTQETKDAHISTINKVFPETHKDTQPTYGDATAIDEHFDQIIIGNASDNVFVQRVNQDDRLTAKGKEMIIGWAAEYNKNRSEYTNELVTNFMHQFDAVSSGYSEHVVGYLKAAKPMIWNELMRTIAEGEAAGISIHAMLGDTNSKHYIGWKFLDVYQTSVLQNLKSGSFQKMMADEGVTAKQFWGEKRDQIYKAFFDVDNTAGAEGNQLAWIATPPKTDKEGNVIEQGTNVIDKKYAIFTQRLLNKPLPPEYAIKDKTGQKETIDEYISSHKYKKYQKDYRAWVIKGEFNSDKIPTINKYFGVTDMPTIKIKN